MIRRAKESDIETIVEFQLAMAWETEALQLDRTTLTKGVKAVFEDHTKGHYWVFEDNGTVGASLMITYEWSDWRNGNVWWIQSVYVSPALRGKGVYKRMYKHLQELIISDNNVRGLRLYVDKSNLDAQRVYASLGMNGEHYQVFEWMKS